MRIYGIPLHAWNKYFFKLSVMECDYFLKTDSVAIEKERFDYAHVLIATSNLEIINAVDKSWWMEYWWS